MRRYSILVTECGANHEVRLCDVDSNPQQIVDGLKAKRLKVYLTPKAKRGLSDIKRHDRIRIIDNGSAAGPAM
jgi:hypothetical protein